MTPSDSPSLPALAQVSAQAVESLAAYVVPGWLAHLHLPRKTGARDGASRHALAGEFPSAASERTVPAPIETSPRAPVRFELLTAALEGLSDPFFTLDRNGGLTYVNLAAERLLGRPAPQLLGSTLAGTLPEGITTVLAGECERALAESAAVEFEAFHPPLGRWLQVRIFPSHGGLAIWLFLREVEARGAEEALRSRAEVNQRMQHRNEVLEAANEELQAFSLSLAHDLRSPIGTIDGFSAMLDGCLGENAPERQRHYLSRIRAASRQMGDYTEALLSMAYVSQGTLECVPTDLSAIATAVLADLQERDGARHVVARVQDGLQAQGDPRLLKMALDNLLGNAWKFTSRRERAEIHFGGEPAADGQTVYYVRDNGAGFDSAYAHKLFGTFKRLHSQSEFPGTGVGLANVHRIVTRHGGRVWAESVEGQGATFYFSLPGPQR